MTALFPGCDADADAVLAAARHESGRLGHNYLGTEHLLLGFLDRRDLLPRDVANLLPADADVIRAALLRVTDGPRYDDVELLRLVGVNLHDVRSAVRRAFGADALDSLSRRRVHQPWQPWKRPSRQCTSVLAGTVGVAPRLKQAIEKARDEADRRRAVAIDPSTLLLGMLEITDALANQLLREVGVEPDLVRMVLREAGG